MATKKVSKGTSTSNAAAAAAVQEAPVAAAPNPFAALVAPELAAAAPTARQLMLAKAEANGFAATVGGVQVKAAPNVAARGANLAKTPAQVAATTYTLVRVPRVRKTPGSEYTINCWAGIVSAGLSTVGSTATGAEWAAASTGDFAAYAVRSGWLQPV